MTEAIPQSQPVTCLSIDVAKSTQTGNLMSPVRRYSYQSAIIELIDRYIPELGFIEYQAKFTGDGWLIFSPYNEDIDKLVVLGKTVCHLYPAYVRDLVAGLDGFEPAVRACICSGQDFPTMVKQQDGSAIKDWLGDSARRASSLASCADAHELLVDQPVNDRIELIFRSNLVDKDALPDSMQPKHDRERAVWKVGELKHSEMDPGEGAAPYVSYLNWTGQEKESAELITAAIKAVLQVRSGQDEKRKAEPAAPDPKVEGDLHRAVQIDTLRKLLRAAPDSASAGFAIARLVELDAPPTIDLFNTLIEKAPDYATAIRWYGETKKAGVAPDHATFDTLIAISRDYATATRWYAEMAKAQVTPATATFNTLIHKAPDYATATRWYAQMIKAAVDPNQTSFNTLIAKARDHATAARWYGEMAKAGVAPDAATFNALIDSATDAATVAHWQGEMTKAGFARNDMAAVA
jgi:hypothetical protein